MRNKKVLLIVQAALIAANSMLLAAPILSAHSIFALLAQFRSDSRSLHYHFAGIYAASHSGLFCRILLSDLLTGCMPLDVVFGSLATRSGHVGTYALRKHRWLAPLPPICGKHRSLYHLYLHMCTWQRGRSHFFSADCRNRRSDFLLCVRYDLV
ncbi:MAG: QueT transporter family protein [Roseburia intestinalis]